MEHVIVISPVGAVKAMHNDKFPLGFLGPQSIDRASDIRWDEQHQSWGIWFNVDGEFIAPTAVYAGFLTYEDARNFEVDVMNDCLKRGASPTEQESQLRAIQHRRR